MKFFVDTANLDEIREANELGLIDGVTTSSAVVAHEMAGVLDRVKRVNGLSVGLHEDLLPHGNYYELSLLDDGELRRLEGQIPLDWKLIERMRAAPGSEVIKAAGNLGYPMGLWIESFSSEVLQIAKAHGKSFEETAGTGSDERTMLGAGSALGVPVIVTIPQLVGGGRVGLAIGDSIPIQERALRLSQMLAESEVIIESAVALTQEIHDGPFETYTGHGLWSGWQGEPTYSLKDKTLIRIDLDPNLEKVYQAEREGKRVQEAIDLGLPKTKLLQVPFRMEMSGFARLEGSVPITGDIGAVWPILAHMVTRRLGLVPGFLSYPQESVQGKVMRNWIVEHIRPVDRNAILARFSAHEPGSITAERRL